MEQSSDDPLNNLTTVESLCIQCQENGVTKLLPHHIPYFRTILISSFHCDKCGYQNNKVEPISEIQVAGERISLDVITIDDLDRQVVKSQFARIMIPELQLEAPPANGVSSTLQGLLSQTAEELRSTAEDLPELKEQLLAFVTRLESRMQEAEAGVLNNPFTIIIDDPSGNSFVENPLAPKKDAQLRIERYRRTQEQLHQMGYYEEQGEEELKGAELKDAELKGAELKDAELKDAELKDAELKGADLPEALQSRDVASWDLSRPLNDVDDLKNVTFIFPCSHCGKDGNQNMCQIDVPGFRSCLVMAFVCDFCGTRSTEVKPTGRYGDKGKIWTLVIESEQDLNRDVLKSDTAALRFPELELELDYGTLGGVFTTVEGLLIKIADEINEKMFHGDAQLSQRKTKIEHLINRLREAAEAKNLPMVMILDDVADLSHIGRRGDDLLFLTHQAHPTDKQTEQASTSKMTPLNLLKDSQLSFQLYERTDEQNDDLGLKDMKTEDY
ncbi:ZPR1 zinc-finger protein [Gregarina niphandrodes]|uniref:ZPR1 zinc-finger protein n=1 Tax=Gregarina niphandrodes TaxID=110365 RepID=A0A023B2V3_GRENI|nr:ZPR1 zinc-finger protein [Gregarina niphandrodes]EZG55238.1 ZPR1 zinc-finger protein [Gregarina niphandrodes]|eukprot:XP_011131689.1 ZPR1 zinc-finger protein [Gregarina niphandrodes]